MKIILQSFGYKKSGIPSNSSLVFDVRGLPNPHDVETLRPLDGTSQEVKSWLLGFASFVNMRDTIRDAIIQIAKYHGKSEFTVSIGCTGGKHRSVAMVENIRLHLQGFDVQYRHLEF